MSEVEKPSLRQTASLSLGLATLGANAVLAALNTACKDAVVAVTDPSGDLICLNRTDGAPTPSVKIAIDKATTAARMQVSTRQLGLQSKAEDWDFIYFAGQPMIGWAGGLPVKVAGQVVGAIAVSGLDELSDEQFARIGVDAIEALL